MVETVSGERTFSGSNPFGVDPLSDLLHPPDREVEHWSENMFFTVWNPGDEVGVHVHIGRCPEDVELWCARVFAMLPDDVVLVDRSWGRAQDDRGPATGNLLVRCETPLERWSIRFDGAGEHTTSRSTGQRLVGAGPAVPLSFTLELEAAAPVWDLGSALGIDGLTWAHTHHEQALVSNGSLTACGRDWSLRGVGFRDHSSGPRDIGDQGGAHFFTSVSPTSGRVAHGLVNWKAGKAADRTFSIYENGRYETFASGQMTGLDDPAECSPRQAEIRMTRPDGQDLELRAEVLHGVTLSLLPPNTAVSGLAVDHADPFVISQCVARYTWPDGDIGYGGLQRSYQGSLLPSPEPR